MSINIQFVAQKGKAKAVFDCWHTPTDVSRAIAKSKDQVLAYKAYILSLVSTNKYYNYEQEHIDDFNNWIEQFESEGFTIKVELI